MSFERQFVRRYMILIFLYINIYTLAEKNCNYQVYIYMLWYTWEQKNIDITKNLKDENDKNKTNKKTKEHKYEF